MEVGPSGLHGTLAVPPVVEELKIDQGLVITQHQQIMEQLVKVQPVNLRLV